MNPPLRSRLMNALAPAWRRLPSPVQQLIAGMRETLYLVSAVGVISDERGRVLLLEQPFHLAAWSLPGGFVARGEQPAETLRREVREEVGLELASVELAFVQALDATAQIELVFRGRCAGAPVPDGVEVRAARWVALDALPAGLHPDRREVILRVAGGGAGGDVAV